MREDNTTQREPLRVAFVGCGKIAEHHARALAPLQAEGRAQLVALVDPVSARREAVSSVLGMEAPAHADDLPSLLASGVRVEAVLIAVPHDLHEAVAGEALRAGLHVLLEKPLAPTLEACARLAAAAAASAGLLVVSEQSPHWPEVARCRELIDGGAIGEVVGVTSDYYESMSGTPFGGSSKAEDDPYDLGWRRSISRAGGGVVIDGGLHWLRPLRLLLGEAPSEVVAATANPFGELRAEGETLAHALLRTPGGKLATFRAAVCGAGRMAHASAPFIRVTGRRGELVVSGTALDDGGGGLRLFSPEHAPEGAEQCAANARGFCAAFGGMWREFLAVVEGADRAAAAANVREARTDVATALAIYESAQKNAGWVRIGVAGDGDGELIVHTHRPESSALP